MSRPQQPSAMRSIFLLMLLMVAGPAQAQPAREFFRVTEIERGDFLSIRERPDADAPALGRVPPNGRVRGFGCTTDTPTGRTWCRGKYGRVVGWARQRYLAPE